MNSRSRLINIRLTDDELQRLKTASVLNSARCLSDFARSAILEATRKTSTPTNGNDFLIAQLMSLDRRLTKVESDLSRLRDAFGGPKAAAAGSD